MNRLLQLLATLFQKRKPPALRKQKALKGQHHVPLLYFLLSDWIRVEEPDPSAIGVDGKVSKRAPVVTSFIYLLDPMFVLLIILYPMLVALLDIGAISFMVRSLSGFKAMILPMAHLPQFVPIGILLLQSVVTAMLLYRGGVRMLYRVLWTSLMAIGLSAVTFWLSQQNLWSIPFVPEFVQWGTAVSQLAVIVSLIYAAIRYLWGYASWMIDEHFPVIPPAFIAVRQFWGHYRFFKNCRIFTWPGLTNVVFIPGDLELTITTSKDRNGEDAVTSFILMDDGKNSDEMLFVLQVIFNMDTDRPYQLTRVFLEEFEEFGIEGIEEEEWAGVAKVSKDMVTGKIRKLIVQTINAHVDEVMQRQTLFKIRRRIVEVNEELTLGMQGPMVKIGVQVKKIAVIRSIELDENGPISQHERATRQEQLGLARQRIAQANLEANLVEAATDRDYRIKSAIFNQEAQEQEQNTRREVATYQQHAQRELRSLEKLIAQTGLQNVIERMKVVENSSYEVLLMQVMDLSTEQAAMVLTKFAENMGMHPETLVNLGGGELLQGHPITAVVEAFRKALGMLPPKSATP